MTTDLLNNLASIAAIIEAAFVVISVLFIWRELRVNTKLARSANTQAMVELSSPFNLQLIQDRQMAELWVKGAIQYTEMDEVDKYRYESLLTWWLILHENLYYQWRNGLLDRDIYATWNNDLEQFAEKQNLGLHWDKMRDFYQAEFANHVSQLIEKHRTK